MEPYGTVKIFRRSFEERGVFYSQMVGDRDSSTHAKVVAEDPYGWMKIKIEKIDCCNHYVKRFKYHYDRLANVPIDKIDNGDPRVTLKGKNGLQNHFLVSLQVYLSLAVKRNANNLDR